MTRAPITEPVSIPGPAGNIEAIIESGSAGLEDAVAVVCHPHPLYHGTMSNKVVHTIARSVAQLGRPAVRFNFRGVGHSDGAYAEGVGEALDARAVVAWSRQRWPQANLWLAGFSFGAYVALSVANDEAPSRLLMVAPPIQRFDMTDMATPGCPWLVIQGDRDELVDANAVEAWAASMSPAPELVRFADTDHFFHGRLTLLRQAVSGFFDGPSFDGKSVDGKSFDGNVTC